MPVGLEKIVNTSFERKIFFHWTGQLKSKTRIWVKSQILTKNYNNYTNNHSNTFKVW